MPHTTAAMLELDYQHRVQSPLDAKLRARLRWVAAHALGCAYSQAYATADLLRAGESADDVRALAGDRAGLPDKDRTALTFAHKMIREPYAVTDDEVARLVQLHGEKQVVAMVLLLAHAGFQDRLLLALDLPLEAGGVLRPVPVRFAPVPLGTSLAVSRKKPSGRPLTRPRPDRSWQAVGLADLQTAMENQRCSRPRIRLPVDRLGKDIHWGLVCRTYQPALAAGWAACRRAFGAEANQDPVFEASVLWVVTRTQQSFY
jgi:alkylhydroperoxidase family enzyme